MTIRNLFKFFANVAGFAAQAKTPAAKYAALLPSLDKSVIEVFTDEDVMPFTECYIAYLFHEGEVITIHEDALDFEDAIEKLEELYEGAEILRVYGSDLAIYEGNRCIQAGQVFLTEEQKEQVGWAYLEEDEPDLREDWPLYVKEYDDEADEDEEPEEVLLEGEFQCEISVLQYEGLVYEVDVDFFETHVAKSFAEVVAGLSERYDHEFTWSVKARDWQGNRFTHRHKLDQTRIDEQHLAHEEQSLKRCENQDVQWLI
ncbi:MULTISPECIES: hypothetical protein [unclassified Pseudovibrio]|uniref:hypothetical protein n=1 Tax=unclassified Pseudovibrio TaxID=2627060 RepID=UPI0007AE5A0E|nr:MULTISPECIES: hypothetical protein [unclassified Pseudovibrio]KZK92513.1 hypothetical protein PsW74_05440 [Pseudovibrio sp. W74]KZL10763.1 hypothetical protein PsAD14_01235 [Pseudovibrio sp. Ad14]